MTIRDNIKTAKDLQDTYKIILKMLESKKSKDTLIRIECLKQVIEDLGLIIK